MEPGPLVVTDSETPQEAQTLGAWSSSHCLTWKQNPFQHSALLVLRPCLNSRKKILPGFISLFIEWTVSPLKEVVSPQGQLSHLPVHMLTDQDAPSIPAFRCQ